MKPLLLLLCSLALSVTPLFAQDSDIAAEDLAFLQEMEDTVALLAYAVINDSLPEHRFGACREMIPRLVKALKVKNSFQYPFEQLKSVSIQYPQDSSFRIFTWQLYVEENEYRYYGTIQMNTPELKLYPLVDRSFEVMVPEQEQLEADNWYGAVYYNLMQADGPAGRYYLLFGFDGHELFRKRKLIDVLRFGEDGEPIFGAPVFVHGPNQVKHRVLREYSAEVSTRLNYDEMLGSIVFDHLIPRDGPYGEGTTYYPDGSYEGYRLSADGLWVHQEKLFNQVSDEAPTPAPILDRRERDIFGRKGN